MKKMNFYLITLGLAFVTHIAMADDGITTLREGTPLTEENSKPQPLENSEDGQRKQRSYPMQPPTIPHKITNYQLDLKANKCLSCHARQRIEESLAPMISVTHYMDRDGNFLAEVSPRRYFCTQCHVTQTKAKPLVDTTFQDMHTMNKSENKH